MPVICLVLCAAAVAQQKADSQPVDVGPQYVRPQDPNKVKESFGDVNDIKMLMTLAKDTDPLVREKIARDLGQTHNAAAGPLIHEFLQDSDVNVRVTTIGAARELACGAYEQIILDGLKDKDHRVVRRAAETIGQVGMAGAASSILPLLASDNADVQYAALLSLNRLNKAAPLDSIKALLGHGSPAVRVLALQNAMLLGKGEAAGILGEVSDLAAKDAPAVRAEALAVLGRNAFESHKAVINAAKTDPQPLVRRGAVWAIQHGGKADQIKPLILDESVIVRLSAATAAGALKSKDVAGDLFKVMIEAPDEATHEAARASLEQIATAEVAALAGKTVIDYAQTKEPAGLDARNVNSACQILAALKSREAMDARLQLLKTLKADSSVLGTIAISLAAVDEKSAIADIRNILATNVRNAPAAYARKPPPNVVYSREVVVQTIAALATFGDAESLEQMKAIAKMKMEASSRGLDYECQGVLKVLPLLHSEATRSSIEEIVLEVMGTKFAYYVRFDAMKMAGRLKIEKAVGELEKVLAERDEKNTMAAAAWAIEQITGRKVTVPDPLRFIGEWTVVAK